MRFIGVILHCSVFSASALWMAALYPALGETTSASRVQTTPGTIEGSGHHSSMVGWLLERNNGIICHTQYTRVVLAVAPGRRCRDREFLLVNRKSCHTH